MDAQGDRPEFQLVTGVSAGALTAPFAFLGPAWDAQLSEAYLNGNLQNLMQLRVPGGALTPGFYSKEPLERLVAKYVTENLLAAVAAEQTRGRRLLVATTNLDSEQLMIWDMGAIAAHGGPEPVQRRQSQDRERAALADPAELALGREAN